MQVFVTPRAEQNFDSPLPLPVFFTGKLRI